MEENINLNNKITKTKKNNDADTKNDQDYYCWLCHKEKCNLNCQICPRSYHMKCINNNTSYTQLDSFTLLNDKKSFIKDNWVCFECELISKGESEESKSLSMRRLTKTEFNDLLNYALTTIKKSSDVTFHTPVNLNIFNDYSNFIIHPMDFYKIEQYILTNKYSSTEAFLSDCKWILHNCYIYNQAQNPLTVNARYMLKIAKNEMYEIETCPDCYKNYYTFGIKDFFIQPCSHPHNLVYAKLKGHPLWPSKVVKINKATNEAEVRFFGAHDKAWINFDSCFLLHEKPNTSKVSKNQKGKLESALKELNSHLEILNNKFPNLFNYNPPKTTFKPELLYLIPLPSSITDNIQPSNTSNYLKDVSFQLSSMNESVNLNTDSSEVFKSPPKKQRKSSMDLSDAKDKNKSNDQVSFSKDEKTKSLNESSTNDDSDENEHKLIIDDETSSKRKRIIKKKIIEPPVSLAKTTKPVTKNLSTNSKRNINQLSTPSTESLNEDFREETTIPILPKKKLKINPKTDSNQYLMQKIHYLKEELERSRSLHIEEIKEMYENHKSEFKEHKLAMDMEKEKALSDLRKELTDKFTKEIEEAKRKSWCSFCLEQASYFCCRLASYCSYECQSEHWPNHMTNCLQNKEKTTSSNDTSENNSSTITSSANNETSSNDNANSSQKDENLPINSNDQADNSIKNKETEDSTLIVENKKQKTVKKENLKQDSTVEIEEKNFSSSSKQNKNKKNTNDKIKKEKLKEEIINENVSIKITEEVINTDLKIEKSNSEENICNEKIKSKNEETAKKEIQKSKSHPEKPKDRFIKKLSEKNMKKEISKANEVKIDEKLEENEMKKLNTFKDEKLNISKKEKLDESENKKLELSKNEKLDTSKNERSKVLNDSEMDINLITMSAVSTILGDNLSNKTKKNDLSFNKNFDDAIEPNNDNIEHNLEEVENAVDLLTKDLNENLNEADKKNLGLQTVLQNKVDQKKENFFTEIKEKPVQKFNSIFTDLNEEKIISKNQNSFDKSNSNENLANDELPKELYLNENDKEFKKISSKSYLMNNQFTESYLEKSFNIKKIEDVHKREVEKNFKNSLLDSLTDKHKFNKKNQEETDFLLKNLKLNKVKEELNENCLKKQKNSFLKIKLDHKKEENTIENSEGNVIKNFSNDHDKDESSNLTYDCNLKKENFEKESNQINQVQNQTENQNDNKNSEEMLLEINQVKDDLINMVENELKN